MTGASYCGIDWAEEHHDIALIDGHGTLVAQRRIAETIESRYRSSKADRPEVALGRLICAAELG